MYLPEMFAETRPEELHRIIRQNPLGMLVTHTGSGLEAHHLPFLMESGRGSLGTLIAHVARANTVWQEARSGDTVLVAFRGAQGYISPNWYPSKHEHHRHVPTWNYEIAHVHGKITILDDEKFVRGMVAKLTRQSEAGEPVPWKMGDAPADYIAEQLRNIVGIEVEIERIEGKRKLSQNHDDRDFAGTLNALEKGGQTELAAAMKRTRT